MAIILQVDTRQTSIENATRFKSFELTVGIYMSPHIMPGLSKSDASLICMTECKGMCCRGPSILSLTPFEISKFRKHAAALGVIVQIRTAEDGNGTVRFLEQKDDRCPMLNHYTSACMIYEDRPQRCRNFPERLIPGCAISGG